MFSAEEIQTTRNNMQRDKVQWSMELQNIIQEVIIYSQKRLEHNECLNGTIRIIMPWRIKIQEK